MKMNIKSLINKEDRYFRSSDFYLCCFLYAKGAVLVGIDKITNPKRAMFAFESSPEIEEWANEFMEDRESSIKPKSFAYAIKELKNKLYSDTY